MNVVIWSSTHKGIDSPNMVRHLYTGHRTFASLFSKLDIGQDESLSVIQ